MGRLRIRVRVRVRSRVRVRLRKKVYGSGEQAFANLVPSACTVSPPALVTLKLPAPALFRATSSLRTMCKYNETW